MHKAEQRSFSGFFFFLGGGVCGRFLVSLKPKTLRGHSCRLSAELFQMCQPEDVNELAHLSPYTQDGEGGVLSGGTTVAQCSRRQHRRASRAPAWKITGNCRSRWNPVSVLVEGLKQQRCDWPKRDEGAESSVPPPHRLNSPSPPPPLNSPPTPTTKLLQ